METFAVAAIGRVASLAASRSTTTGTRSSRRSSSTAAFGAAAPQGLAEFSHVEVVYLFHLVDPAAVTTDARRPRGNPEWPEVGIFAQRAKGAPEPHRRLDLPAARRRRDDACACSGLDAIDGTPVLDIKPYMREFGPRGEVRQPPWADEIMGDYF